MSENRFAGLDLDDSFGADYVAKKQEPEPEYKVAEVANDINVNQYQNQLGRYQQMYPNALGVGGLAGGIGSINSYANTYSANTYAAANPSEVVERRIEADYIMGDYVVVETLRNGQRRNYRISKREISNFGFLKFPSIKVKGAPD